MVLYKNTSLTALFIAASILTPVSGFTFHDHKVATESVGQVKTEVNTNLNTGLTVLERIKQQEEHQKPENKPVNVIKTLRITPVELTDNSGLIYLGGKISEAELAPYLAQLSELLAENYALFRQNQGKRDHFSFHMTLINPYEYQKIDTKTLDLKRALTVRLLGLGSISTGDKVSYYVVAESSDGQFFRQQQVLPRKDFHVTLGFNPQDIYGISKGAQTLVATEPATGVNSGVKAKLAPELQNR